MKSFKAHIEESKAASKMEEVVRDYFSDNEKKKENALKTLKNMAQSSKLKDELAGLLLDHGANMSNFQEIGLTEESATPGTTTANIPNPVDTAQGPMGGTEGIEESTEYFLDCPVFDVPCEVHEKFRAGKNRYHRWDRYLDMQDEGCRKVYEYAKTKSPTKIILRNRTGAMIYVKPNDYK